MTLERYLGAARAVRHTDRSWVVALTDDTLVHATLALSFPYRPRIGDQLLVIGDATDFYVIGVLNGRGHAKLSNPQGVSVHAEGGKLRLAGDRGVRLTGRRIRLRARELKRVALTAVETFRERTREVREALAVEAGEVDELSSGRWLVRARRAVIKGRDGARVKSTTVRLG